VRTATIERNTRETRTRLRSARAAQVPFIGIASPGDELVPLFLAEGARAVIDDINHLESAL